MLTLPHPRPLPRPVCRLLLCVLPILSLAAVLPAIDSTPVSPKTGTAIAIAAAQTSAPQNVQVADEIVRRLRRLGLNFNRGRIDRPYDPEGELC